MNRTKVQYWRDELFPRYGVAMMIRDGIVYAVKDGVSAQVGGYNNLVTSPNRVTETWLEDTLRENGWIAQWHADVINASRSIRYPDN